MAWLKRREVVPGDVLYADADGVSPVDEMDSSVELLTRASSDCVERPEGIYRSGHRKRRRAFLELWPQVDPADRDVRAMIAVAEVSSRMKAGTAWSFVGNGVSIPTRTVSAAIATFLLEYGGGLISNFVVAPLGTTIGPANSWFANPLGWSGRWRTRPENAAEWTKVSELQDIVGPSRLGTVTSGYSNP